MKLILKYKEIRQGQDVYKRQIYDNLIRLDIKEYYGRIYTHKIDFNGHEERYLSNLNCGATNGLLMGCLLYTSHVKKSHIDAFCAFGITVHFICSKDLFKVLAVLLFPLRSCRGGIQPCIITASGGSGHSTKLSLIHIRCV